MSTRRAFTFSCLQKQLKNRSLFKLHWKNVTCQPSVYTMLYEQKLYLYTACPMRMCKGWSNRYVRLLSTQKRLNMDFQALLLAVMATRLSKTAKKRARLRQELNGSGHESYFCLCHTYRPHPQQTIQPMCTLSLNIACVAWIIVQCNVHWADTCTIGVRARTDASIWAIYIAQVYIEEYCTTAQSFSLHAMFTHKVNLQ